MPETATFRQSGSIAKYQVLKNRLLEQIKSGELKSGKRAPSEAILIEEFGVSSTTARRCLNDLANEGYLQRVQGKGTFVSHLAHVCDKKSMGILCNGLVSMDHPVFSFLVGNLESNIDAKQYVMEVMPQTLFAGSPHPEESVKHLVQQRNIHGMFVLSPIPGEWLEDLQQQGFPLVSVGIDYEHLPIVKIMADTTQMTNDSLAYLSGLGHKHIAVFVGRHKNQVKFISDSYTHIAAAIHGFTSAHGSDNINIELIEYDWFDVNKTYNLITTVLNRQTRPTAILTVEESIGRLAWDIAYSMNLQVPDHLSIMLGGAGYLSPHSRFTTICPNIENLTWRAARIMEQLIEGERPVRNMELIGGKLVVRESTGVAPS
jgi:GntR family transcriptional regulator, arabinose operon transcriptional repressor